MKLSIVLFVILNLTIKYAELTVYFQEKFEFGKEWQTRWVESTFKGAAQGKFILSAGKFYGDSKADLGIQTSEDSKFYTISTKFKPFSNEDKTLVIQFTVKHEQNIDCGGGYIKLFPKDINPKMLHGGWPYYIMFGPDICGYKKKVQVVFNYDGKYLLTKKDIKCKDDVFTHLYTLIVEPNNTYVVKIDNQKVESGKLEEDWNFLPPKKIPDPNAKKPHDWDEREKIFDPKDTKPVDWDKPEFIPDPYSEKPFDWNDDIDGKWEPAKIKNPEFRGRWKPRKIKNPNFKGIWVPPEIKNPEYVPDNYLYRYTNIGAIGFEIWQVKSGTIFDNILITDNEKFAEEFGKETWEITKYAEKRMKEKIDEEEKNRINKFDDKKIDSQDEMNDEQSESKDEL